MEASLEGDNSERKQSKCLLIAPLSGKEYSYGKAVLTARTVVCFQGPLQSAAGFVPMCLFEIMRDNWFWLISLDASM